MSDRPLPTDPCELSVGQAMRLMRFGELSPVDIVESSLRRIEALEPKLHAWVEVLVPDPDDETLAIALPFDPCHLREPDLNYLTVAVGRDYADVTPVSGTYSGSSANRLISSTRLGVALA